MSRRYPQKKTHPRKDHTPAQPAASPLKIVTPWNVLALVLVILAAVIFSVRPTTDSDFWHHLALGRIITEQGRFPVVDELSSTAPGRPWVSSGWLPTIVLYNAYKAGPTWGPAILISMVTALVSIVIFTFGIWRTRSAAIAATITISMLAACTPRFLPRPDIFSQLMLPPLLLLLFWYDAHPLQPGRKSWMRAAAMPLLFMIWANLHMLFAIGLGLLGIYVLSVAWDSRRKSRGDLRILFAMLIASIGSCLITPYGWRAVWFIWENTQLDNTAGRINELKPLWTAIGDPGTGIHFFMLGIWIVAAGWLLWRGNALQTMPRWRWIFMIILVALALIQRRQVALAVPGITLLALSNWRPADAAALARFWQRPAALAIPVILLAGQAAGYISTGILPSPRALIARGGPGIDCEWYPCEAVDFLRENPPPEKLFHDLYSGSFLAYQLSPTTHVFIDGRLEVYNNGTYDDFFAPPEGRMDVLELLHKYDVKSALLDWRAAAQHPGHTAIILSQNSQWRLCWFSDHYALFVKDDETTAEYLAAHAYKFLNPLFPQSFMDALANPTNAPIARTEARRAASENPGSYLAQKAIDVSGQ